MKLRPCLARAGSERTPRPIVLPQSHLAVGAEGQDAIVGDVLDPEDVVLVAAEHPARHAPGPCISGDHAVSFAIASHMGWWAPITLIGLVTSMFTSVWVTKVLMDWVVGRKKLESISI